MRIYSVQILGLSQNNSLKGGIRGVIKRITRGVLRGILGVQTIDYSSNHGNTFWGSLYTKDYRALGSIFGSPSFEKPDLWA